ncbi:HAMP domain-containing histidine kinase [Alteromonas sp. ASW11-19]|uniref:histidine kinase n=1 Tax=Alteromonas salexigens TaxID=2982530 RepID=A0ABT2VQ90_9ALTE|nr:HAMP domain-containing sensor histidine kinase [Alteromonas salexigens]MCU7555483.1 HAMP domain-containing histidine kinase [Alteromonas salexigens]
MIAIGAFTRSSSFRVGAILTTLVVAAMLFIIYIWRITSGEILLREATAALNADHVAITTLSAHYSEDTIAGVIASTLGDATHPPLFAIADNAGRLITGNITHWPVSDTTPTQNTLADLQIHQPDQASRTVETLYEVSRLGDNRVLFVGRSVGELSTLQWIGSTFSWVVLGLLAAVGVLSFMVAVYVVNRINRMSHTAEKIIRTGDLQERMEIDSNWDDLSQLAVVFNGMLDKIEASVDNIKNVTDNIAHDLRTPLARLRGTLEHIDDDALREQATQEADNLLSMFNSLLRISDIETKRQRQGFTQIALHTVVGDVTELYQPLIEGEEMTFSVELDAVTMTGDPNLLFQAVANAIDNALKYAGKGHHINVSLRRRKGSIVLSINDDGPGLDASEFSNLERRFFRASSSRTTTGNGLGLSLVSAIITLHHGALWFVDDPLCNGSGLGVVFTFPEGRD